NKKGKEYVLRSVDKNFGNALPDEARGTFMSRIAKDQASIGHPFSGITIVPMAEAAGIYHTSPIIVFVPEQPGLGEYNKEYGNQLYMFEERPDENQEDAANFGYSKNLIGSDKLFEKIYKDNNNHVDQLAFVRARLFDMVIGDWGRHPDNWRWAEFKTDGPDIYKPVPRDRDQAYTKMDGFYPSLAGSFYKPFQGFNKKIKNVADWNKHALPLDRIFLNELEKNEWITQAEYLQKVLTDTLISYSIHLLPPEIFAISGNSIIDKLKSRRDHLKDYANDYYDYLAKNTDIAGTDEREFFSINRLGLNETEIDIYKITKEGDVKKEPYYTRKFIGTETKEIRIYGLKDDDRFEIKGEKNKNMKIRIIDPQNKDSIAFDSKDAHHKVNVYTGKKYEYDTLHQRKFDLAIRPLISSSRYKIFDRSPLKLFPRTGIKILASLTYIQQPWKKDEYETVHHFCANYGILRNAFNFGYIGRFGRLFGKWDFVVKARMDAPAVENFFGVGNNTQRVNKTTNYYATFSERAYGSIGVESNFSKVHHFEFAFLAQSIKVHDRGDHYISSTQALIDPSVFERKNFMGVESGYSFLKVNNENFPTAGVGINLGAGYIQNIENQKSFVKGLASAAVFVPFGKLFSLAIRAGGATMSGTADYYNLNSIGGGGGGEMRGYDRERFYGKQSFYLNNDLRWLFNTRNYFFNGKAGLLAFYDMGRVWQPGEESNSMHGSYGFGVIIIPYNKFALTATYGISSEATHINFKTGFFF
ncbi:MAG: ShlB/FhaC/HecB family hemolysin secretion/activation protein, partial [Chitinophagaceae bacterium]